MRSAPRIWWQLRACSARGPRPSGEANRGSGLGLAIAEMYAHAHGGELSYADASPHGARFELEVKDSGIGFEPQYAERIFGMFQRLHGRSAFEGTGIGLAICRKIVERHGGTIVAHGVPGQGALFTVTLPYRQPEEIALP